MRFLFKYQFYIFSPFERFFLNIVSMLSYSFQTENIKFKVKLFNFWLNTRTKTKNLDITVNFCLSSGLNMIAFVIFDRYGMNDIKI